jgi:hypothetical protein
VRRVARTIGGAARSSARAQRDSVRDDPATAPLNPVTEL